MVGQSFCKAALLALLLLAPAAVANAENEGQADLDKAIEEKLTYKDLGDLGRVIDFCESALTAGLDKYNSELCNQLLSSTLLLRAEAISNQVVDRPNPPARWEELRILALRDLEQALKVDPNLADASYLIGRLQALPGGDAKRATEALNEAIKHAGEDKSLHAKALAARSGVTDDPAKRQADLDEAVKLAPHDASVLRTRAINYMTSGKHAEALADLDAAIKLDPDNPESHEARGLALLVAKKFDEAVKSFDKAIELAPKSSLPYANRARVLVLQGKGKEALADLDRALKADPRSVTVLLLRARVNVHLGQLERALVDVDNALVLRPGLVSGLQLRASLYAALGRYTQAIIDLERLQKASPENEEVLLQLASMYAGDKQPKKSLELFSGLIEKNKKNWNAYRGRADVYLLLGSQTEAAADYDAAITLEPENSNLLNNLAWLLCTSPNDKLRDGKRAITLATKACEISKYKQAHILSTLAAAYAETGDFAKAKEWSQKAVAMGEGMTKSQLQKELDSYQQSKPWREASPPPSPEPGEKKPDDAAGKPKPSPDPSTDSAKGSDDAPKDDAKKDEAEPEPAPAKP